MSDDEPRITDKRGQRSQPAAPPPVEGELRPDPSLFDDRMEQLRAKGARNGLTDAERAELLDLQALEDEARQQKSDDREPVTTAFVIVLDQNGAAMATSDLSVLEQVVPERVASLDDIYAGSTLVLRDINASLAGRHTLGLIQQQAAAIEQQQMAARLAPRGPVNLGGSRRR